MKGERLPDMVADGEPIDAMSSALWSAYEATVFCATLDGTEISIRPGQSHEDLDRALRDRGITTWAFVTAWNPGSRRLGRADNDARHARLKEDVARLGFESVEGVGKPSAGVWEPEHSLLVLAISAPEAVALGRRYGQNAIVIGECHGEARLMNVMTPAPASSATEELS